MAKGHKPMLLLHVTAQEAILGGGGEGRGHLGNLLFLYITFYKCLLSTHTAELFCFISSDGILLYR